MTKDSILNDLINEKAYLEKAFTMAANDEERSGLRRQIERIDKFIEHAKLIKPEDCICEEEVQEFFYTE